MKQLNEFITLSKQELEKRRSSLDEINKKITSFLDENLVKQISFQNVMVQGRVKGSTSLSEKIVRKRYADRYENDHKRFISELPDIIGLRVVCLLLEQEKIIYSTIISIFTEQVDEKYYSIPELKGSTDNLLVDHSNQPEPQKNGKPIFRLSCKWLDSSGEEVLVELQIKSLINMFWGEVEHMLFYKNYTYMIGSDFYKEMMNSIYKSLEAVDSELQLMSQQLAERTSEEQLDEMKQMFAKLMYNMFSQKYREELIDIEVDLREIYDLMVQIEFKNVPTLSRAQQVINRLITNTYNYHDFNNNLFEFDEYNLDETILKKERRLLGLTLGSLSQSNDVFWISFIGLYKMFAQKSTITEVIDTLSNELMTFYSHFDAIFTTEDEGKPGKPIIKEGIEVGIIHAFSHYRKLDFFLTNVHQQKIVVDIHKYLEEIKDRFLNLSKAEIDEHGEKAIINVLEAAVSIKVMSIIESKIKLEYLNDIYSMLREKEFSGIIFDLSNIKKRIDLQKDLVIEEIEYLFVKEKKREEE
ncbi:hypothetical protein [Peribacillus frigoritolerans]|uniref:hypothetical protein n=1 Tax=Peribacillus frigoritolerans TaxID=450367 RepID=UPI0013E29065|nr:hypothetical protein [Peribacillus frigoritolerans]